MTVSPADQFLERFTQAWSQPTPDGVRSAAESFVPADFMRWVQELGCFNEVHLREEPA